jgi:[histone H3]-lysine36 N-dimethyltransferase SETMAR
MDFHKFETRSVIKFLVKEGKGPKEIHDRLMVVYKDTCPSYTTIKFWSAQFKQGRESIQDDERSGRPATAVNKENCQKIESMVMANRRLKANEIAKELSISKTSVLEILHDCLGMSKVCARWVPRMLSPMQKQDRMQICQSLLDQYNANPGEFVSRIVTGDETWVHHWDPESKQESMQWKHKTSPSPVKFRTQPSAGKIMATIFWDSEGPLLVDYMPHKTTITGGYYANLLLKLREAINNERLGKLSKGVLILHDNAPVHKAHVAMAAFRDCGFEELPHPPYSPDLAPSDYYLFQHLKSHLRGTRFESDSDLKQAVSLWLEAQPDSFYKRGIEMLKDRWTKCIRVFGSYTEK